MYKERRYGGRGGDRDRGGRSGGGGFSGGRGGFSGGRGGRDTDRQMHEAICDQCGKPCKVPFRPSGDRPIFCSECFEEKGGNDRRDDRRDDRRSFGDRVSRDSGRMDRDSSNRYGNNSRSFDRPTQSQSMTQEQFQMLNDKLDRILKALSVVVPRRVEDHVEGEEERFEFQPKKKVRVEDDQKIKLQ